MLDNYLRKLRRVSQLQNLQNISIGKWLQI